jgi:uncharacterized protein (DUF433 family)
MSDNPNIRPPLAVRAGSYEGIIHTHLDENGVAWIDDTNVKVAEIVWDKRGGYATAEEIHQAHPDVSLAQTHAALAYYYDHQEEVDALMRQWDEELESEKERSLADRKAWREELRARWARRVAQEAAPEHSQRG